MSILQTIGQGIVAAGLFFGSLFGYHQAVNNLGITIYKPVPRYESSLSLALTATQTSSMTMVSGVDGNGMTLSGLMCFTLDSGVAGKVEDLCGTASGTVVSNLTRGVDTSGITGSSTLSHAHRVGADVKTTDSPYFMQYYGYLNGTNGFPNPLIYASNVTNASQTANNANLVSYGLLASTSFNGVTPASTINPGIVKMATSSDLANGNTTTTYELAADSRSFSSSSVTSTQYSVPVAVSGTISAGFINNTSPTFNRLSVTTATSTASTSSDALNILPAGIMQMYASTTAPAGWLLCDGTSYASTTYPRLYAVIGTAYGNPGGGNFNVPNMTNRFPYGGTSLGTTGGTSTITLTIGNLAPISFSITAGQNAGTTAGTAAEWSGSGSSAAVNTQTQGSSTPFSILNPYVTVEYIIKY